jgi:hypothetical protein
MKANRTKSEFEPGQLVEEARPSGQWRIAVVRAEEERIIVECQEGVDPFWLREKICPPLDPKKDKLRDAIALLPLGGWGRSSASEPMQTRAQAKASAPKEITVILQLSPSGK